MSFARSETYKYLKLHLKSFIERKSNAWARSLVRQSDGLLIHRPGVQIPSSPLIIFKLSLILGIFIYSFLIVFYYLFAEKYSLQIHRMQFLMPKVSVEIPQELLDDLNRHVGDNKKFVSQSDAIRTAVRKMLDMMDEIDRRHGRLNQ